jgi:hypothetical protein
VQLIAEHKRLIGMQFLNLTHMKTSIIYLGILTLIGVAKGMSASNFKAQDSFQQEITAVTENSGIISMPVMYTFEISSANEVENTNVAVNQKDTIELNSLIRSIEDVIAEDKLITDAQEVVYQPITIDRSLENTINENQQIIDCHKCNEYYPLDFDRINDSIQCVKEFSSDAYIGESEKM